MPARPDETGAAYMARRRAAFVAAVADDPDATEIRVGPNTAPHGGGYVAWLSHPAVPGYTVTTVGATAAYARAAARGHLAELVR